MGLFGGRTGAKLVSSFEVRSLDPEKRSSFGESRSFPRGVGRFAPGGGEVRVGVGRLEERGEIRSDGGAIKDGRAGDFRGADAWKVRYALVRKPSDSECLPPRREQLNLN